MKKRFKFKKRTDGEYAKCYYCNSKTHFALYDKKDESEVWCCQECALKIGKIKRLKNLLKKYPLRKKSTNKIDISLIKKQENSVSQPLLDTNSLQIKPMERIKDI